MVKLGFISEQAANADSTERILLYEMWKLLDGDSKDEVYLEDLKTLIMCISRILDGKRVGIQSESDASLAEESKKLGQRDKKGRFVINVEDANTLMKQFELMHLNKVQF